MRLPKRCPEEQLAKVKLCAYIAASQEALSFRSSIKTLLLEAFFFFKWKIKKGDWCVLLLIAGVGSRYEQPFKGQEPMSNHHVIMVAICITEGSKVKSL